MKTILVVDDEAPMRMSFKAILKDHFNVVSFAKGTEALRYIKENPGEASAAFIDYSMPDDLNGDEVCVGIRSLDEKIQLIGISGADNAFFSGPIFAQLQKKHFSVAKVMEIAKMAVDLAQPK